MNQEIKKDAPLADRMRPRILDEFVGQPHILSPGRLLRRAIQADQLSSVIFFGPPGTGKTTLARIIANTTKARFLALNAVLSGVKDIRSCIEEAKKFRQEHQRRTILFIDEVHRFNKSQQDALLPHVENGTVILIGATTENPYFEVNKALVSRSRIFQLRQLDVSDLREIIQQALRDKERGYGDRQVTIDDDAVDHLVTVANGDARALLNALELAVVTSVPNRDNAIHVDMTVAEESIQQKAVLYDKDGDAHFDTISAFIKSLRGSDPDAALYWMAKMVYGGEDPKFIFRRMIIFAAEDIGMADPEALKIVMSAAQAFDYVGMPEGRFHLAEACLYLSTAPKSNSGFAFFDALSTIQKERDHDVPNHLKDGNRDKEGFGHGQGYLYPHSYQEHWVVQQYLPSGLQGRLFYQPSDQGYEAGVKNRVLKQREAQLAATLESAESELYSSEDFWQGRTLGNSGEILANIRDHLFTMKELPRDAIALDLNAGSGLLLGELIRSIPEGTVYASVDNENEKEILESQYSSRDYLARPIVYVRTSNKKGDCFSAFSNEEVQFDIIMGKGGLPKIASTPGDLNRLWSLLSEKGWLIVSENLMDEGQRLSEYLPESALDSTQMKKIRQAETMIFDTDENDVMKWNQKTITSGLLDAGFLIAKQMRVTFTVNMLISKNRIDDWFRLGANPTKSSYAEYLSRTLSTDEIQNVKKVLMKAIGGRVVDWKSTWLFVAAEKNADNDVKTAGV